MRAQRAKIRPETADLRLRWPRGGGRTEGRKDVRTYGRLEIPPCVLQDIGPLGPLPKKRRKEGLKEGKKERIKGGRKERNKGGWKKKGRKSFSVSFMKEKRKI